MISIYTQNNEEDGKNGKGKHSKGKREKMGTFFYDQIFGFLYLTSFTLTHPLSLSLPVPLRIVINEKEKKSFMKKHDG